MMMGMDTAWCLACSKQLENVRSTYCSDACRLQDAPSDTEGITRPCADLPSPTDTAKVERPSAMPLQMAGEPRIHTGLRDRRAYSFPLQVNEPALCRVTRRQTQDTLQFVRKSQLTSSKSPRLAAVGAPGPVGRVKGFGKLSKTTGHNTPFMPDSVFCSNSENSDNETNELPLHRGAAMKPRPFGGFSVAYGEDTVRLPKVPIHRRLSNVYDSSCRPPLVSSSSQNAHLKSPSPVARMIATSAGSKSRDDIVCWLNEVEWSPNDASSSRRSKDGPTPTQERSEWIEEGTGTTPQRKFGSALSTLRGFSVVKAFTNVTSGTVQSFASNSHGPVANGFKLDYHTAPAQAEVSKVAVTAVASEREFSGMNMNHGGATPTLSSVSMSEVVDPLTDAGENIDFFTDEQSNAGSSAFVKHRLSAACASKSRVDTDSSKSDSATGTQTPLPLRQLTNTAQAIRNLSNYLRSLAPLSFTSVLSPIKPAADPLLITASTSAKPKPKHLSHTSPAANKTHLASPLPAIRHEAPPEPEPPEEIVRSLPMDIINPRGLEDNALERKLLRRQEALDMEMSCSENKSRTRARNQESRARGSRVRDGSPSRARSRGRSNGRRSLARELSKERGSNSRHRRRVSYDADASGEEEAASGERRGRSRREKGLQMESMGNVEESRGRNRAVRV
ncbi:uncharacterized protein L203_102469 [Cryptococcus depauperatus CBS 7841]|uniref:Uncharacterized protein n=1 Tax=Cryptococcus depauperatus CBS 7841 TaxID=1295531 RepID=A0A1E3HFX5_9TREE|nr:hypothetical protein L203_06563 [Cryptococcus depauperatus CBS 7841]